MERLCDLAAVKTGIDRIEIRRRNLVAPEAAPYRTRCVSPMTTATTRRR